MSTPLKDTRAISLLQLAINMETTGVAIKGFQQHCHDTVRAELAINALICMLEKDIARYKTQNRVNETTSSSS